MFNPPRYPWADVDEAQAGTYQPTRPAGTLPPASPPTNQTPELSTLGFSPNYLGNTANPANRSADIPPELSCSLFIANLPAATTVKILLQELTTHGPFDRIYACHVTEPDPSQGFITASAKLTTFTRPGAERLYRFIASGRLILGHYRAQVVWNRNMVGSQPLPQHYTRVLCIRGPKHVVDGHALDQFLREQCGIRFHAQDVFVTGEGADERVMVWQFGSYRCQAETVRVVLRARWPSLVVQFGEDPCAVGIQGRLGRLAGVNVDRDGLQEPLGMVPGPGQTQLMWCGEGLRGKTMGQLASKQGC
jgi:hypothetical protein